MFRPVKTDEELNDSYNSGKKHLLQGQKCKFHNIVIY